MQTRYAAHTLDGTRLFVADTAQQVSDAAIDYIKAGRRPLLAYTFDNEPGSPWPYTTWLHCESSGVWVGSPWRTFGEVVAAVKPIN